MIISFVLLINNFFCSNQISKKENYSRIKVIRRKPCRLIQKKTIHLILYWVHLRAINSSKIKKFQNWVFSNLINQCQSQSIVFMKDLNFKHKLLNFKVKHLHSFKEYNHRYWKKIFEYYGWSGGGNLVLKKNVWSKYLLIDNIFYFVIVSYIFLTFRGFFMLYSLIILKYLGVRTKFE